MMRTKFYLWLMCVALSSALTTIAIAEDVYVTKYGKKYHKADSAYLEGREVTKLTREEAEEEGYKPSRSFLEEEEALIEEEMEQASKKKTAKKKKKKKTEEE